MSRCGGAFGSNSAPTNVTAAAAVRYIAGARVSPLREMTQSATSGVVPPSTAIPMLYATESTVHRTRQRCQLRNGGGEQRQRSRDQRASPTWPTSIPPVSPCAMSAISGYASSANAAAVNRQTGRRPHRSLATPTAGSAKSDSAMASVLIPNTVREGTPVTWGSQVGEYTKAV